MRIVVMGTGGVGDLDRGSRLGIPTPCNRAIYHVLSIHSAGSAS